MTDKKSIVLDSNKVKSEKVEKGEKIWIQRLITDDEGANNCFMRKFTLEPGASMPLHSHEDTDHVQYILEGMMKVKLGDKIEVVEKDDALYIPSGLPHSYENPYEENIKFLCIVPAGEIQTDIESQ
ncbi:MAG: cupin domain-containing protein [Candidatus Thermoplasmatota archaeon]|nr:cupin domain-containing protein [Candidatus Thermoplasmatota archaeon]